MPYFELTVIAVLFVFGVVGFELRIRSYNALFLSLKERGKLTGFDGPDYTWTEDERIVSGQKSIGNHHGSKVIQLKTLIDMVADVQLLDMEKQLVRRAQYGQQAFFPLVLFAIIMLVKYVVLASV